MKIIIIEDSVYRVTEKQFSILKQMESDIGKDLSKEEDLAIYLDQNRYKYQLIGPVDFDFRR